MFDTNVAHEAFKKEQEIIKKQLTRACIACIHYTNVIHRYGHCGNKEVQNRSIVSMPVVVLASSYCQMFDNAEKQSNEIS